MKSHATTILLTALMALNKLLSVWATLRTPEAHAQPFVPLVSVVLLIVACVLTAKQRWQGPLLAMFVIGFYLFQFLVLGKAGSLFVYFILHVIAFVANVASFRALRK